MSKEAWTLVGVVVGALLGGGAQIVNAWLQAKRDREKVLREERRTAYTTFSAAIHDFMAVWTDYQTARQRDPGTQRPRFGREMGNALAVVELLAPKDTYEAAGQAVLQVVKWQRDMSFPPGSTIDVTDDFMGLAKRDIGVQQCFPDTTNHRPEGAT